MLSQHLCLVFSWSSAAQLQRRPAGGIQPDPQLANLGWKRTAEWLRVSHAGRAAPGSGSTWFCAGGTGEPSGLPAEALKPWSWSWTPCQSQSNSPPPETPTKKTLLGEASCPVGSARGRTTAPSERDMVQLSWLRELHIWSAEAENPWKYRRV